MVSGGAALGQLSEGLEFTGVWNAGVPNVAVVLAGVGLAVVMAVGGWTWRTNRQSPGRRLTRVLGAYEEVAVLMHPDPDPDAMACAAGVAALAADAGTEVVLLYPGEIRHPQNRAFATVLDLEATAIEQGADIGDRPVVLVDHDEPRGFTGAGGVEPVAVVDHHPGMQAGTGLTDCRPDYGACSSIVAEYFRELGYGREGGPELPSEVATGLLFGILSDTNRFTRGCSPADFDASAYLYPAADAGDLDRIGNPEMDVGVLETKVRAITDRESRGPFVVSDVGDVCNRDAVPVAADELLHLEGVSAVVALGTRGDTIHLSGRSRDDRIHMGNVINETLSDIPMADGGGHARMGGGQISIPHMEGIGPSDGVTRAELRERLFDRMGGD